MYTLARTWKEAAMGRCRPREKRSLHARALIIIADLDISFPLYLRVSPIALPSQIESVAENKCRFALRPAARDVSSRITRELIPPDFLRDFHHGHYEQSRPKDRLYYICTM